LGIQEYFQYDPTGDYLQPQLKGRELVNGQYELLPFAELLDGSLSIHSQVLGLDLRLLPINRQSDSLALASVARELRLFDPQTGTQLLTYFEAEQARQEAEQLVEEERQRAEMERQRAEQAEQQLAALLKQLESRGIAPDSF
jgi:hypothetical protein